MQGRYGGISGHPGTFSNDFIAEDMLWLWTLFHRYNPQAWGTASCA